MKHFLKIYLWQVISLITGFATMFVVTPFLASNQSYFGIYTFVISLNLFLSYADFGFLNAGAKFASEAFARDDREEEIKILGFVFFILICVFFFFGILILIFYFDPHLLLKGLHSPDTLWLAKNLFLVFVISLPIMVGQRGIQLIFNIRLKDYKFQRVYSLFNVLKIVSSFFFFRDGEYHIVAYYIFTQIITLASVIIGGFIAKRSFSYNFYELFSEIKFSKLIYEKTKGLAYNSLYVTVSWVLYYELDSLIIGKFVGLKEVAIFNVCISVMSLARSLYGILYNPFSAKFNHFLGRNQHGQLTDAFKKILTLGLPICIIPTTILIFNMRNFILTWVGPDYISAIPIVAIMFASYYFTFLSNPTSIAMVALQNIKGLYVISTILPILYWIGIILTFQQFGLLSFGIFKFVAFFISAIFYFYFSKVLLGINWKAFFKDNVIPVVATIVIITLLSKYFNSYLPVEKGKTQFFVYVLIIGSYFIIAIIVYYLLAKEFRLIVRQIVSALVLKKGLNEKA